MGNRMTCPVCGSHTSSVLYAVRDGEPCPHCGAPADVIERVNALQETRADSTLKAELERTIIELGKVTAERDRLALIVAAVQQAVATDGRDGDSALADFVAYH